mgnify:FL=1
MQNLNHRIASKNKQNIIIDHVFTNQRDFSYLSTLLSKLYCNDDLINLKD